MAKKIEMLNDQQEVVHPLTSSDCVIMENGKTLEEVMGDGIATPTVTHEGASFQVGVGDSNIEVVDGEVAGMTLEGQTYQNILPKPTTLIMETDEKEFKINDKIDNNIILDDNVAEIATIKGQTYVNTVQEESASEYVAIGEELNGQSITTTGKPEGYVKNATLEGLTLVNTIQEPSEANSVVLDLDADINAQGVTINNTAQGGIHGAKLNGMTLLSLTNLDNFSKNDQNSMDANGYITVTSNGGYCNAFFKPHSTVKENTAYLLILDVIENTIDKQFSVNGGYTTAEGKHWTIVKEGYYIEPLKTGRFTFKVSTRTKAECTDGYYMLRSFINEKATVGTKIKYRIQMIEYKEGMENWDIPYFEGMQSVEVPSVMTTGKNLFDGELITGKIEDNGKPNTYVSTMCMSANYTRVKPNTTYNYKWNQERNNSRVFFYDVNKNFIKKDENFIPPTGGQFTTPSNCYYILFHLAVNTGMDSYTVLITKSNDLTYEPYKSSTLTTPSDVVLRKVGDVQDELNLETGELTQRIGEVVLNGSESWWDNTEYVTDTLIEFGYNIGASIKGDNTIICDKFQPTDVNGVERIYILQNGNVYIRILKTKVTTVDEFKTWLASNPITVQYQLKTPITKKVDLSIVDQSNNSLKTIQAQPTLTHITTSSNGLIPFVTIPSQLKYPTIIKPSTTYTVQLKQTTVNSEFPLAINLGGTTMAVPSTKFTITTPETLTSQDAIFTGKNNVIGEVVITEGDTTGIDYRFFEGMKDVKSPSMYATGKNLINENNLIKNYYINDNHELINHNRQVSVKDSIKISPNCTYTLSMKGSDAKPVIRLFNINKKMTNKFEGGTTQTTFTTNSSDVYMSFNVFESDTISDIQIEEGLTATSYEPYKGVTIEQDIDSIPLTSDMFGQGYYDYDKVIKGMSIQQIPIGTDAHYTARRIYTKSLIKVKPNSRYKVVGGLYGWFLFFDKNGNAIGAREGSLGGVITNEFTTDSNTYYVGLVLHKENNGVTITPSDIPSDLTLQEVPQEIVLRSLPNGVKDTLNLTTGEYVQRIGEVVFDGSDDENWFIHEEEQDNYINKRFRTDYLRGKILYFDGGTICNIICDKVQCYPNLTWKDDREGIEHDSFYVSFRKNCETVTKFKQCLSQDPITIQYQLITPIITKVNLTNTTKLPSYNSITHYDTILPSNSLIPNIKIPSTIDYNVAIKPSTQYTIRANTASAMSVDLGGSTGVLANGKVILTTPSTLAHNSLKLGNGKTKEVMVIEGSEIKDNVPFFNGMKNVQMGGIKLVNIARGGVPNTLVSSNANGTQYTYTSNGSTSWGNVGFDMSLLKTDTIYTVYMEIVSNTSDNGIKVQLAHGNVGYLNISAKTTGVIKQTVKTAPSFLENNYFALYFRNSSTSGQQVVVKNFMVIEGDWTHLDEIPYIESEMIIEQPIIRSQGKNLFDGKLENGSIDWETGVLVANSNQIRTVSFINVLPNKTYKLTKPEYVGGVFFYDKNKNHTKTSWIDAQQNVTVTTTDDTFFLKILLSMKDVNINIQLEEGTTATTYEPYKHQTLYSNRVIGYEEGVHYGYGDGVKYTNANYNSVMADVEGLSIAYVTNGSSNFTFWNKDGVFISGKGQLDTALSSTDKNGFIQVPSNAKYMKFASSCATGSNTDYTKATVTGELPLRSLPSGVCDSFNLVTGEYVQRVGEVVLDGINIKPKWIVQSVTNNITSYFDFERVFTGAKTKSYAFSDKFVYEDYLYNDDRTRYTEGIRIGDEGWGSIRIFNSRLETPDYNGFVKWLQQNPVTVQYELATPIVRKIGLTAKGNYKEVELNGSEDWQRHGNYGTVARFNLTVPYLVPGYDHVFSDVFPKGAIGTNNLECTNSHGETNQFQLQIKTSRLKSDSVDGLKQWLSQNPLKVGYLSTNSASLYTNIQKPIFFNNVKVQFMNDNVDIQPTLTLQSRSRNSYVMDMMKENARYTLKALNNSSSFTIDGTSYNATTNGTFTSPSTLTNKLLITGQDAQELMIIEGDVTGKAIPYYKGIRSSFDNTDEIEVLSINKNLLPNPIVEVNNLDIGGTKCTITKDHLFTIVGTATTNGGRFKLNVDNNIEKTFKLQKGKTYTMSAIVNDIHGNGIIPKFWLTEVNSRNAVIGVGGHAPSDVNVSTLTVNSDMEVFLGYNVVEGETYNCTFRIQVEESPAATPYQPHKENSTIINMPMQLETVEVVKPIIEVGRIAMEDGQNNDDINSRRSKDYIPVEPGMILTFMNGNTYRAENIRLYGIDKNYISAEYTNGSGDLIIPKDCYFIRFYSGSANTSDITVIKKQYKPIALNSLPNGVKDELIINRATSSAKLIQRVGKIVLDGSENWSITVNNNNAIRYVYTINNIKYGQISSNIPTYMDDQNFIPSLINFGICSRNNNSGFNLHIPTINACDVNTLKQYLKQNPTTVYYELAEPVVTEIRLKGYPFVYKDGSVQLNTEIPHTTKVKYNVNQEQLINGQNETIIRHDKQIDNLYDYIELYLEEEYRMELFRMQLELSL